MTGIDLYIRRLLEANPLREPVLRSAIQALQLPPGSRGLDVGCGIGLQALLLADEVGPEDISPAWISSLNSLLMERTWWGRPVFPGGSRFERGI